MPTSMIDSTLGALQIAATFSGVPFASGAVMIVQSISSACSQVAVHKTKSAQLVQRCTTLLNTINEQSTAFAGTELAKDLDEAEAVLMRVHRRVQRWSGSGKVKRFLKSWQIERDLDKCYADVNAALECLQLSSPMNIIKMQQQSIDMMRQHQMTMEEGLQQLLISPREVEYAVQQHNQGGSAARELMRIGQERLVHIRGEQATPTPSTNVLGETVVESPESSCPPSPVMTVQNQLEQALLDLHRLTNIPPTIPILNNQIKRVNSVPVCWGRCSTVYEGSWLGGKKVALKTWQLVDRNNPRSQILQERFEHEIIVWSKLKHENVLTLYGIVTNMGPVHIISPWQENGTVLTYRRNNPDVDPLKLLRQAAKGLEYLHNNQIVHGHIQCSNLLVSSEGIVTVCDFGLTQVLLDVVGEAPVVILSTTSAIRWHAPELGAAEEVKLTMPSDIFAFGMSILELLTLKQPYSHRKCDVNVVHDLLARRLPPRPEEPEAMPWMTDSLWATVHDKCWAFQPENRITIVELSSHLEEVSASLSR
ncbi:kinase-like domain-containing protein [Scleroderma yunnanense]